MNIKQIHREAMVFAQEAHLLQQNGDFEKSIELFEKAFELEQQAALFYLNQDKEPTRSILFKSAAALANNCKRYRDAEKMIGFALSGNPPIEIADEIRNLYLYIMNDRIKSMVEHWKKYHWAKSNLSNDDTEFYKAIRMSPLKVATTSFTGSDVIYYKASKVVAWNGSMISVSQYKKNLKNRK